MDSPPSYADLGHATLHVYTLISTILPSDTDLGHATSRVVDLISASLYPLFLCPVLMDRPGLPVVLCLPSGRLEHGKIQSAQKVIALMWCGLHNCFDFLHDRHWRTNDSLLVTSMWRDLHDNRRFLHHSKNEKSTDLPPQCFEESALGKREALCVEAVVCPSAATAEWRTLLVDALQTCNRNKLPCTKLDSTKRCTGRRD